MANVASIETLRAGISRIRMQSELACETAVETAGAEYPGGSEELEASMQSLADGCDDAWQRAEEALEAGNLSAAREALEEARTLEDEGGDDSHARSALELLAPRYGIECRHASGSSHWAPEPEAYDFDSREEAEAAIESLEAEDEEGAALEYRVVEVVS